MFEECRMNQNQELFSKNHLLMILMKDLNGYVTLFFHISQSGSYQNRKYFSHSEKKKIFIPWQTYEIIKMFTYSLLQVVKFLLENFVLTEKFNQDR